MSWMEENKCWVKRDLIGKVKRGRSYPRLHRKKDVHSGRVPARLTACSNLLNII